MQMIALHDLGRINAQILCQADRYAGQVIELSGQDITGKDLQDAFSHAAGRPIRYQRFSEELLSENDFLKRLTALVDSGVVAGIADIAALEREFGPMLRLDSGFPAQEKRCLKTHSARNRQISDCDDA